MTGCAPTYLTSQFVKRQQISSRTTRNSQQLNIPLCKTTAGQRSFYYRKVKLWNSLDKDLKLCESHTNFKKTLKTKLLSEFLNEIFFISLLCTYLTSCIILFTEKPFKECTIKFYLLTYSLRQRALFGPIFQLVFFRPCNQFGLFMFLS